MAINPASRTARHRMALALAALALSAATLAGCGSNASPPPTGPPGAGSGSLSVTVARAPGGEVYLVDNAGKALYLFESDTDGASTCNDACAAAWPPVSGSAGAGDGLTAPLTTTSRDDGTIQAVYNGHPLYYFRDDTAAGQTNGQGLNDFGGLWYVLDANGSAIIQLAGSSDDGGY